MAYSLVGSITGSAAASGTITVSSVNPTAVGDVLVVWAGSRAATVMNVTALSHSGVSKWVPMFDSQATGGGNGVDAEAWYGVVTATGSATLTVTFSGTPTNASALVGQFHSSVAGAWTTTAGSTTSSAGTSGNYPSLTIPAQGAIFIGNGFTSVASPTWGPSGTVSGYTYTYNYCQTIYNNSPSTPASPGWTLSSNTIAAFGDALLYVANPRPAPPIVLQAWERASIWCRRASGLIAPPRGLIVPRVAA